MLWLSPFLCAIHSYQERYFVGRGMYERLWDYFRWVILQHIVCLLCAPDALFPVADVPSVQGVVFFAAVGESWLFCFAHVVMRGLAKRQKAERKPWVGIGRKWNRLWGCWELWIINLHLSAWSHPFTCQFLSRYCSVHLTNIWLVMLLNCKPDTSYFGCSSFSASFHSATIFRWAIMSLCVYEALSHGYENHSWLIQGEILVSMPYCAITSLFSGMCLFLLHATGATWEIGLIMTHGSVIHIQLMLWSKWSMLVLWSPRWTACCESLLMFVSIFHVQNSVCNMFDTLQLVLQLLPMVVPTRLIVELNNINYVWHDFVSKSMCFSPFCHSFRTSSDTGWQYNLCCCGNFGFFSHKYILHKMWRAGSLEGKLLQCDDKWSLYSVEFVFSLRPWPYLLNYLQVFKVTVSLE